LDSEEDCDHVTFVLTVATKAGSYRIDLFGEPAGRP
jgi:hypothetical protein